MTVDNIGRFAITVICLCMFGAFAGYLVVKGTSEATLQLLAGALIAWCGQGINWFLSSSAGSAAKDKIINTLTTEKKP